MRTDWTGLDACRAGARGLSTPCLLAHGLPGPASRPRDPLLSARSPAYPSPARAWYEADEDNQLAFAGDIEGFRQAVDAFVAQLANVKAENIAADTDSRFFSQG